MTTRSSWPRRAATRSTVPFSARADGRILQVAATVVAKADARHPADQVLRQVLKSTAPLPPAEALNVVRAVFGYYRWRGWLDPKLAVIDQLRTATELAESFALQPGRFRNDELAERAVPDWTKQEVDGSIAWFRSLQSEPRLWLRARSGQGPTLAAKLEQCRVFGDGPLQDTLEYDGSEDLFRSPEFHAGEFEVQDLSSQAVGLICSPRPKETWWDACAGEGGKLLHLSDLMANQGLIWAADRAAWRLQKLKRRAARAKVFNYRAVLWREGAGLPIKTKFDGVLVDAPCSGLGTWQRNPHARWTTGLSDLEKLAALQRELLTITASAVKPGGRLVYSVCTLARSETTQVADAFEKRFPEFEPVAFANPLRSGIRPQARVILWPQEFGGNGMFIAVWKRREPTA